MCLVCVWNISCWPSSPDLFFWFFWLFAYDWQFCLCSALCKCLLVRAFVMISFNSSANVNGTEPNYVRCHDYSWNSRTTEVIMVNTTEKMCIMYHITYLKFSSQSKLRCFHNIIFTFSVSFWARNNNSQSRWGMNCLCHIWLLFFGFAGASKRQPNITHNCLLLPAGKQHYSEV